MWFRKCLIKLKGKERSTAGDCVRFQTKSDDASRRGREETINRIHNSNLLQVWIDSQIQKTFSTRLLILVMLTDWEKVVLSREVRSSSMKASFRACWRPVALYVVDHLGVPGKSIAAALELQNNIVQLQFLQRTFKPKMVSEAGRRLRCPWRFSII